MIKEENNKATPKTLAAFDNMSNLDVFFQTLSLEYNKRLYPRESLIVFDEIQRFPKARQAIKYLVADGRYDYIETGSLISIRENVENITLPSEERKIKMYPLDFEEFMMYMGDTGLLVSLAFSENEIASRQLYKQIMNERLSLNEAMIYENMISQMIAAKGSKLYFYTRLCEEKHRNDIEIDFLLSNDSKINLEYFR